MTGKNCDKCINGLINGTKGTLLDDKDNNKEYKTIVINCQEWMAENYQRETGTYYYPYNNSSDVATYGLLYTWYTATSSNFCPTGWHLPTYAEFDALRSYVLADSNNNNATMSKNLRATSWSSGADKYGFGALPVGKYNAKGYYNYAGSGALFWSSTEDLWTPLAYGLKVDYYLDEDDVDKSNVYVQYDFRVDGMSVRCLKDDG